MDQFRTENTLHVDAQLLNQKHFRRDEEKANCVALLLTELIAKRDIL